MSSIQLTEALVNRIYTDCLWHDDENLYQRRIVHSIDKIFFNINRLLKHQGLIEKILHELPNDFKGSGGGGMSALNAYWNKDGIRWTHNYRSIIQLFTLGIPFKKVEFVLPRNKWQTLDQGIPYFVINEASFGRSFCHIRGRPKYHSTSLKLSTKI